MDFLIPVSNFIFERGGNVIYFIYIVILYTFVGSLIGMRFIGYGPLSKVKDDEERVELFLSVLKRLFTMSFIAITIIFFVVFVVEARFHLLHIDPLDHMLVHMKQALWIIILGVLLFAYHNYTRAKKALEEGSFREANERILIIVKYNIPTVFTFGLLAIAFGSIAKGLI